jgi:Xaa-Pro aminopeptidase
MTYLIYGAPGDSPDLFHTIPTPIIDPFLYIEADGRRAATVTVLDAHKVSRYGIEIIDPYELGADELLDSGMSRDDVELELCLRAAHRFGVTSAIVPAKFPIGVADHLRAGGIELVVDSAAFATRRRVKTEAEIAGIRRAQAAADEAMGIAARMIHEQAGVTSEAVRAAMQAACDARGCDLPDDVIVSHGPQGAIGHEAGYGEIGAGEPVIVDIWPRDRESRCWADMTRTFVGGGAEPPAEIAEWWRLTREALEQSHAAVRAGVDGREVYARSCEPFEAAGIQTQRSKPAGEKLEEGYYHSLGHGVGLEVHEHPGLGRTPDTLIAGDVITLEPGCYRKDIGGVRLEDLVIVTDDGAELLTNFPYEL